MNKDLDNVASQWLQRFEDAFSQQSVDDLRALFAADSYWRDVLALTWTLCTVQGATAIAKAQVETTEATKISHLQLDGTAADRVWRRVQQNRRQCRKN